MWMNNIKNILGDPFYESENCLIYCGDSLELLEKIDSELFDLTITSPPYNIGKEYEKLLSIEDYLDWSEKWINNVYRLTKNNGAFWLNLGYFSINNRAKAIPIPYLLWERIRFFLIQEIIWNYGAGVAGKQFFSPRNEKFLWYVKNPKNYIFNLDLIRDPNVKYPNQKKNGKIKVNHIGKNPSDVWYIPKVTSGTNRSSKERTPHPAQFPEAVIDRIIKASSNSGDLVFDPFLGSGSTAIVAIKNGRNVVGFEIREDYCKIAVKRIEDYLHRAVQNELF